MSNKLEKHVSYEKIQSRGRAGQHTRAVARRRAIVDANKAQHGRSGESDNVADSAEMETDRGIRKHRSQMGKRWSRFKGWVEADPNYAKKWAKIKVGQKRHAANRNTVVGKALNKSSRGVTGFGGKGLGFGGKAMQSLNRASKNNWWNKV